MVDTVALEPASQPADGGLWLPAGQFIPHTPPLLLVDFLSSYTSEQATVTARVKAIPKLTYTDPDCADSAGSVPGFWALEYFAQSVAVFFGYKWHNEGNTTRLGFILAVDDFRLANGRDLELDEQLTISARLVFDAFPMGVYEGDVVAKDGVYATARIKCYVGADKEFLSAAQDNQGAGGAAPESPKKPEQSGAGGAG